MTPFVSVIIPTFNYAQYIGEAINSVLNQDYAKDGIEIIVVDDGSTDNTKEVLSGFIANGTVRYFFQQNQGKASATNKAVQETSGKYIFNLDADDYFLPGKINRTIEVFESDESIVHVASPAQLFNQQKQAVQGVETLPARILQTKTDGLKLLQFFYCNNILYGGGSTYAARAGVLKTIQIPAAVDMYIDEFLMLAVLPFGKSYFFREPLSVWRVHSSNYSVAEKGAPPQQLKTQRLLQSSDAVLNWLQERDYDNTITKIYNLKHSNRMIASKEVAGTKSFTDIAIYIRELLLHIQPGFKLVRNYQVLNRLLPLPVYLFLKRVFGKY